MSFLIFLAILLCMVAGFVANKTKILTAMRIGSPNLDPRRTTAGRVPTGEISRDEVSSYLWDLEHTDLINQRLEDETGGDVVGV